MLIRNSLKKSALDNWIRLLSNVVNPSKFIDYSMAQKFWSSHFYSICFITISWNLKICTFLNFHKLSEIVVLLLVKQEMWNECSVWGKKPNDYEKAFTQSYANLLPASVNVCLFAIISIILQKYVHVSLSRCKKEQKQEELNLRRYLYLLKYNAISTNNLKQILPLDIGKWNNRNSLGFNVLENLICMGRSLWKSSISQRPRLFSVRGIMCSCFHITKTFFCSVRNSREELTNFLTECQVF